MAATITVLYTNLDEATFNLDYYLTKHMPLVDEKFNKFGLKGWRVVKGTGAPFGGKPLYSILATLEFENEGQFRSAVEAEGAVVFGDVPNFTNIEPVVVIGEVVGVG